MVGTAVSIFLAGVGFERRGILLNYQSHHKQLWLDDKGMCISNGEGFLFQFMHLSNSQRITWLSQIGLLY